MHTFERKVERLVKDLVRVCLPALLACVSARHPAEVLVVKPAVQPAARQRIVPDGQGAEPREADAADSVLLERGYLVVVQVQLRVGRVGRCGC
jgi:hypothetical protein